MKKAKSTATPAATDRDAMIEILKNRFARNIARHKAVTWEMVEARLAALPEKWRVLHAMENTGGEPDVVGMDRTSGQILFYDCSPESPSGRRSVCFDREGWESRKEARPDNTAAEMAAEIGISILNEEEYRFLQSLGHFDAKTSSWIATPGEVRKLGGALFGDYRYGRVFIYHNGAQSYYAARGFRGSLSV